MQLKLIFFTILLKNIRDKNHGRKIWLLGLHGENFGAACMYVFLALDSISIGNDFILLFTFLTVIHCVLESLTEQDAEPEGILEVIVVFSTGISKFF